MYTLLCDPHRGEKYPFFKSILFPHLWFSPPPFVLFFCCFLLREKALCLLFLLFISRSLSFSLLFGWTDVRGKGKHLNTLAQWWTQAKGLMCTGSWTPSHQNNNTPSRTLLLILTHTLTHTHSVSYSANTHSPACRIQRPIKTVFKIKAQK